MISIVLYGRNDSYGYNLHKRAALSLNCMAEVLTGDEDEILFVDYNTPNDYPTFPEAIADTLTDRARNILRIFRVRPETHDALFANKTHLKALEPISRNVAIRRSNPRNQWILSTNTDMIFVPRTGMSLTDLVASLDGPFYCAPRIEVPESLWEGFDRCNPVKTINEIRELGEALHLNEIVRGSDNILYDGPGDFQLMQRDDLFAIDAFNEEMLLGWHVDSNISRRMKILHGSVGDAAPIVYGYHCDHTRQLTPLHSPDGMSNDHIHFVDLVKKPRVRGQASTWGLADHDLEEIRPRHSSSQVFLSVLKTVIDTRLEHPTESQYASTSFDSQTASPEHILPFLVDLVVSSSRGTRIAWIGMRDDLFESFDQCWRQLGFIHDIDVVDWGQSEDKNLDEVDAFVVNFGVPETCTGRTKDLVLANFWNALVEEKKRVDSGLAKRRIITVNSIHNSFEHAVIKHVACAKTPFSARLRHGYLISESITSPDFGKPSSAFVFLLRLARMFLPRLARTFLLRLARTFGWKVPPLTSQR